ncbi:MAG: hypothetical protein GF383_08615 [Candidatus Lokiarchaeota archaeon]|nr:hypothetical protein [Candidatus Lokiarchaeota archaeon]
MIYMYQKEKIQQIDIKKRRWNSGMFPDMTNEQLADVLELTLLKAIHGIIDLKKKYYGEASVIDVFTYKMFFQMHREIKKRLVEKSQKTTNKKNPEVTPK